MVILREFDDVEANKKSAQRIAKYLIFIKSAMIFLNLMRDGVPKIEKVFIIYCKPANKAVAPVAGAMPLSKSLGFSKFFAFSEVPESACASGPRSGSAQRPRDFARV